MEIFQWVVTVSTVLALIVWWYAPILQMKSWASLTNAKDRAETEDNFRRTVTQLLGGIGLVAGLFLTLEEINASRVATEAQIGTMREQIENTKTQAQQRLVSDRFADAVNHLANPNLFVRVGAIQMLEEVAVQSRDYSQPVVELLSALIRIESQSVARYTSCAEDDSIPIVPYDIQAALSTISDERIPRTKRIDLTRAYLPRVNLSGTNLANFHLGGADLCRAGLNNANLENVSFSGALGIRAVFTEANLTNANLTHADFTRANFGSANFTGANLYGTILDAAYMRDADLSGARLHGTRLRNADLQGVKAYGADLSGILGGLTQQQLSGMMCDDKTKLPPGKKISDCAK